jgi:hypothetical protein
MCQQAVSADIIPNSVVEIFSPKTEGTKTKAVRVPISCYHANLEAKKFSRSLQLTVYILLLYMYSSSSACCVTCRHYSPPPPLPTPYTNTSAGILERSPVCLYVTKFLCNFLQVISSMQLIHGILKSLKIWAPENC